MPKVTLPDGSVLVGPKADEYVKAQAKAHKAAKEAAKKKVVEAKKAGDADAAWEASAELASAKAYEGMSSAEVASTKVLEEIRSGKHGYTFHRITSVDGMKFTSKQLELELHPSLLKKSGKAAIDLPENAVVAVMESNRYFRGYVHGRRVDDPTAPDVNYICAVIPPEMVAACIH